MNSTSTIEATLLFRGVSREMHDSGMGLRPRNAERLFRREVRFDGSWKYDGAVILGPPTSQAVHAHQRDSEAFNGPGLSFSTAESVAKRFATTNGLESGVIYVVATQRLIAMGCALFDPREHTRALQNPDEGEVIVVPPLGVTLTLTDLDSVMEVA